MATKMKLRPIMAAEEAVAAPTTDKDEQAAIGYALASAILHVIDTVMKSRKMTRKELASRLGKSEATISRQLDDSANLGTRTIGELFWGLGDTPQFTSKAYASLVAAGVTQDLATFVPDYCAPTTTGQIAAMITLPAASASGPAAMVAEFDQQPVG
jgi:hypothetical protein